MSYEVLWAAVQSNQYSYNKNFSKNQINDYISAILGSGAPEFCWMIDYVCQKPCLNAKIHLHLTLAQIQGPWMTLLGQQPRTDLTLSQFTKAMAIYT